MILCLVQWLSHAMSIYLNPEHYFDSLNVSVLYITYSTVEENGENRDRDLLFHFKGETKTFIKKKIQTCKNKYNCIMKTIQQSLVITNSWLTWVHQYSYVISPPTILK